MSSSQENQVFCPACQKNQLATMEIIQVEKQHCLYEPEDRLVQNKLTELLPISKYIVQKCGFCGLEFANPLKAPCEKWYEEVYRLLSLYPESRWEFDYVLSHFNSTDLVGEIGCGSGNFLEQCKLKDIDCHGVDFSQTAISECLRKGLSVSLINLTESKLVSFLKRDKRSAIFSAHTLEHLDNPNQLFELAWAWSLDDATLWISVPSDKRASRLFSEVDFLDQPPHHVTRWNPESLRLIGSANGWKLQTIIYEPISLKASLWSYATRLNFYKKSYHLMKKNIWFDRLLRHMFYPVALVRHWKASDKISGFSMLAQYSKVS